MARPIARWLSERSGIDLERFKDCAGFIAWIAHTDAQPGGFTRIKKSTAALPREAWDQPAGEPVPKTPPLQHTDFTLTSDQQRFAKCLIKRGAGEWKDGRFQSHTVNVRKAHKALKLLGDFDTVATGKDGPGDRNCFLHPQADGSWRVIRHGKGVKEAPGWFVSRGGWTTCILGRKLLKTDAPMEIVELAKTGELFHDEARNTFATIEHRGQQETVAIGDDLHRSHLRLVYTDATGQIASREAISTVVDQLRAIARSRNEYKVAIRVAEHDGDLFIDLANAAREIVRVTPNGYSVITTGCPVRFRRVAGMLPLPTPIPGGNVHELFAYLNVDEADRPLMTKASSPKRSSSFAKENTDGRATPRNWPQPLPTATRHVTLPARCERLPRISVVLAISLRRRLPRAGHISSLAFCKAFRSPNHHPPSRRRAQSRRRLVPSSEFFR